MIEVSDIRNFRNAAEKKIEDTIREEVLRVVKDTRLGVMDVSIDYRPRPEIVGNSPSVVKVRIEMERI